MNEMKLRRLQRMIDKTVKTSNAHHAAQQKLMEFCIKQYGCEPGDIDADQIIDGVLGANGACPGMSASDFDEIMRAGPMP